jgi:Tfp pilus assembly pilus retraction ATPase PilT
MAKIDAFLRIMGEHDASDLHIGADFAPMLRIHGVLEKTSHRMLTADEVKVLAYELLTDAQIAQLEKYGELDCALHASRRRALPHQRVQEAPGARRIVSHDSAGDAHPGIARHARVGDDHAAV